jgi:hypothetical protein
MECPVMRARFERQGGVGKRRSGDNLLMGKLDVAASLVMVAKEGHRRGVW